MRFNTTLTPNFISWLSFQSHWILSHMLQQMVGCIGVHIMAVDDACVSCLSITSTNTTFLSKATDYFSHMLLQRWEAKICRKEKSPQPVIELTTTRSWVLHAHHWATPAELLQQKWETKICKKESFPQPGIKLTTTRSWVRHTHHLAGYAGLFYKTICWISIQDPLWHCWKLFTLSQRTNFRLDQTERVKADVNFKFDENGWKFSNPVENTVVKGEITRYKQFLLLPQCFPNNQYYRHLKTRVCLGKG